MKGLVIFGVIATMVVLTLTPVNIAAQDRMNPQMHTSGQAGQVQSAPGQPPAMGPGMMGGGMMGGGMMGRCMMGMPMMQQMMASPQDPKAMGRMLQMRGEMMKAMGDILIKYGTLMVEEAK
ncbi:MAG: hypothetical protein ABID54_13050 [Pseudomonadota bacterium]